jgi:hypothetical protein
VATIIFSGDRLRALRQAIQLNTAGATIASGSADPLLAAPGISLSPGSLYLSTSTGRLYVKRTTTGDDTNFDVIPQLAANLAGNRVVITDASGNLVTDAELTYDAATDTFTVVNLSADSVNVDSLTASSLVKTDASKNLVSGSVLNADVDPAAAIALSKLAAITADRALQSNGSGVISASAVTSTELGYLSGVTSAVQTQLNAKLNKAGDSMTGDLVMGGNKITSLGAPTADGDAANKGYVDSAINGLAWKNPVRAIATSDQALSGNPTIDGVALSDGDRVLLIGQLDPIENGIYVVNNAAWVRASDLAVGFDAAGTAVFVQEGTVNADNGFVCTSNSPSLVGTASLVFVQFTGAGQILAGVGLAKTGNTLDVNLGAGISQLPTDQVGIDLFSASGLMLTLDGTSPSTNEDSQLSVRLDSSTLAKSVDGLKVATGGITNNEVSASAAIAYSKLNLSNSIVNADISATAAIAYSKLALSNSILDADINSAAAITRSKLANATINTFATNNSSGVLSATAVTANRAVITDANGLPAASATTNVELGYLSGVTSGVQGQIDAKVSKAGDTMTGALNMGANQINNLANPTLNQDAATKAYVDSLAGTVEFEDNAFRILDDVDNTKKLAFEVSALTTATTRTVTMPDANVNLGLVLTAVQRNGSVAFTADQSMGGFKLTNLAAPTLNTDAVNKLYVDDRLTVESSNLTLTTGGTLSTSLTHLNQVLRVQGDAAGTTVLSTTPFGTGAFKEGQIITVVGNSDTNVIQIDNADIAKGCIMNASFTGARYDAITFIYSLALDRFVEVSRNN